MALRGDEDVLSLMNELSSKQGYSRIEEEISEKDQEESRQIFAKRKRTRLLPELEGYPKKIEKQQRQQQLDLLIWNPYVSVVDIKSNISNPGVTCSLPSTTPQVEIFRRRAHERFKDGFIQIFEQAAAELAYNERKISSDDNPKKAARPNKLWHQLNVVSLMERWHLAVKMKEYWYYRNKMDHDVSQHEQHQGLLWTTQQVYSWIYDAQDKGNFDDPVLARFHFKNNNHRKRKVPLRSILTFSNNLLFDEIVFDWKRAWKKCENQASNKQQQSKQNNNTKSASHSQKDKKEESNDHVLEGIFASTKFQRKVTALSHRIRELCKETLGSFTTDLQKKVQQDNLQSSSMATMKKLDSNRIPRLTIDPATGAITVSHQGLSFSLHAQHYEKLQRLFDRQQHRQQSNHLFTTDFNQQEYEDYFLSCLFSLLCRYDMIQGAGLQAAVSGSVLDFLHAQYNCRMECFASPLNCRYERYCSAFVDTDSPFGSFGSFFDMDFSASGGCFQANPPFTSCFIHSMCQYMEHHLDKVSTETSPKQERQQNDDNDDDSSEKESSEPLMFIIFVPSWKDTEGYKALAASKYMVHCEEFQEATHYYSEGTQYRRKTQFRVSSFDTSVFFLQSTAAQTTWSILPEHMEILKKAFCTLPNNRKRDEGVEAEEIKNKTSKKKSKKDLESSGNATRQSTVGTTGVNSSHESSMRSRKRRGNRGNHPKEKKKKKKKLVDTSEQLDLLRSLGI